MSKHTPAPSLILLTAASFALMLGVVACNNNQTPPPAPAPVNSNQLLLQSDQPQSQAAGDNLAPRKRRSGCLSTNDNDSNNDYDAER